MDARDRMLSHGCCDTRARRRARSAYMQTCINVYVGRKRETRAREKIEYIQKVRETGERTGKRETRDEEARDEERKGEQRDREERVKHGAAYPRLWQ